MLNPCFRPACCKYRINSQSSNFSNQPMCPFRGKGIKSQTSLEGTKIEEMKTRAGASLTPRWQNVTGSIITETREIPSARVGRLEALYSIIVRAAAVPTSVNLVHMSSSHIQQVLLHHSSLFIRQSVSYQVTTMFNSVIRSLSPSGVRNSMKVGGSTLNLHQLHCHQLKHKINCPTSKIHDCQNFFGQYFKRYLTLTATNS